MTPRWKKAGPNGEIEITIKGKRYKIEKALDHNERHRGEWKIMVWDKRREDWMWDNTVRGKAYAKELVMDKLDESTDATQVAEATDPHPEVVKAYKKTLDADDKAAEYNHRGNKARVTRANNHLSKMIAKHHPGLDSKGKIAIRTKLQNMSEAATPMKNLKLINKIKKSGVVKTGSMKKEEMTTTASIPNPADTAMGPRFKAKNVTDRRRKKQMVLLKRFRKYMEDNA
jgi:hypothetical protein